MRMVSPTADACGGCWGSWTMCHDPTYVHKPPQRRAQQPQYQEQAGDWSSTPWSASDNSWRPASKSPRRRTQSPRQRNAGWRANSRRAQWRQEPPEASGGKGYGKGQEKGKQQEKGGAAAFGHLPPPLLGSHHQQRPFLRKLQHLHQLRGRPRVRQCSPLASHDRRKKMQNF